MLRHAAQGAGPGALVDEMTDKMCNDWTEVSSVKLPIQFSEFSLVISTVTLL